MREDLKIIKGQYIIKQKRKIDNNKPICPICQKCTHKDFCNNRKNLNKMKTCVDCKNCSNADICDTFYIAKQYKATITVGRDLNGNALRKSFSSTSEDEAVFKAIQYKKDFDMGLVTKTGVKQKSIYSLAMELEEKKYNSGEIKSSTYIRNIETIKLLADKRWAFFPIDKVRRGDLEEYLTELRLYSNSSITKIYNILKRVYQIANYRLMTKNKFFDVEDQIKMPKSVKEDKKVCALTLEQENRFIEYIKVAGAMYKNIYLIALYTGMRIGEIVALTVDDINFKGNYIDINKTVTLDEKGNEKIGSTKTSNGKRKIVINKLVKPILQEAIKDRNKSEDNLIFCRENGNLMCRKVINAELSRICKKIGLPRISMHALRHTFATRCVESGMNFKALQGFMGHADIQTTLDTYADLQDDFKIKEMKKLDKYFENGV